MRYDVNHVTAAEPKRCEPNVRIRHAIFSESKARLKSSEATIASFLSQRASASRPKRRHKTVSHDLPLRKPCGLLEIISFFTTNDVIC